MLSARFAQIREAYDILGDEGQRAIYDSAGLQPLSLSQGPARGSRGGRRTTGKATGVRSSYLIYDVYLELLYHDCCKGVKFSR